MIERGRSVLALVPLNLDDYLFNLRPASLVSFILVLLIRTAGLLSLGGRCRGYGQWKESLALSGSREAWT